MFVEYLSYLATFLATTGLALIGTLVSYQCFQNLKKPVLQILLYQQIFLFTFFIYGIWGNIAIREIMTDVNFGAELDDKLALFAPLIGTPFLMVSWFMLLKFSFNLNGYKIPKIAVSLYFIGFIFVFLMVAVFIHNGLIRFPEKPDISVVRGFVFLNLAIHIILIFPFLKPGKSIPVPYRQKDLQKTFIQYFAGVLAYSILLPFFNVFGFITTCIAILVLFAASIIFPVRLKFMQIDNHTEAANNIDFKTFCAMYDISKRESEIVWEICTGKTNKAIAEKLFITLQTVKDHTHRIYTKTDVKSRVQLANLVREKTGLQEF